MNINQYFKDLQDKVGVCYSIAQEARSKSLDPLSKVEVPLAMSLAEKSVKLIATLYPQLDDDKIVKRVLELEKSYGKLDPTVSFKIAEEIAKEKYCKFETQLQAINAGIRVGFAYNTLAVVSSPIEGFTDLKLGKTKKGEEYFIAYFSGPIRSAGTTATCLLLMIIDYLREIFGYAKYDPTEEEVKRYMTENTDYHERVTNLQYMPTEEEMEFLAKNLPFQLSGDPTEQREVSNFKDLERVETNQIRGGMCLAFSEGLAQKAAKGFRLYNTAKKNGVEMSGWDFLEQYLELHKKREKGKGDVVATYIKDIVAGRPVFSHPSRSGGFRFRYGRSRVNGFSATSVHPALMAITDSFLSTGTQLKVEKPTKGCVITSCDSIDGPIVKLKDGSVKKLQDFEEAKKLYKETEEIIYLGDLLFPVGDVINRNYELLKPGYVEEWWELELKKAGFSEKINLKEVEFEKAKELSEKYKIPLHPNFIYFWSQINYQQFMDFLDWLGHSTIREGKLLFPYNKTERERFSKGKRTLELLGVEQEVATENVVLNTEDSKSLLFNLGIQGEKLEEEIEKIAGKISEKEVLEIINELCSVKIKDKAGDFVGARMGRPEKAKLRKLVGSPNGLFPVGQEGGRMRSVLECLEAGSVKSDFPIYYCKKCQQETIYYVCETCGEKTEKMNFCPECQQKFTKKSCPQHGKGMPYYTRRIDIKHFFDSAIKKLGLERSEIPPMIKGVRGTSSEGHTPEHLAKGILRARHKLCVNKDGTVRYDMTELPITHFKPREIAISTEKLRELGYTKDIQGKELTNEYQVLELLPHDIILPCCPDGKDEKADDVFINVSKFLDDLLIRFYKLKPYYNIAKREELVGHLAVCMSPHNCAGVVARIIGFSKVQGIMASPYMHAAVRRDCFDYDTYMPIKHDGKWKIRKIGELVEELKPDNVVDNYGTKEKKVRGFETIGLDKDLKEVKVNNFTKHAKFSMLEIKTSLGKKIRVTENHKFLSDGKIKRAADLRIGDKLPLPIKIKIKSKDFKKINLLDHLTNEDLMVRGIKSIISNLKKDALEKILIKLNITKRQFHNFNGRNSYPIGLVLKLDDVIKEKIYRVGRLAAKRDNVEVPIIIELTDELLETIGLYIAEGYSRSVGGKKGLNQVYISSNNRGLRSFVSKTILDSFGLHPSEKKEDRVTFSSKVFYLFFTKILNAGSSAKDKRIPSLFLDLKLEKLACLLRGYFEGDGSVSLSDRRVSCDTISEGLLSDLEFCLSRFRIFSKKYEYEKEPGPQVREFYIRKKRKMPKFKITKLIIGSDFVKNFGKIGFLSKRKNKILKYHLEREGKGMKIDCDGKFIYDPIVSIICLGEKESYCLNVNTRNHLVVANSILSKQCDGDELAAMLLLDVLINFSRMYLPAHRGGTQDAPLVLNSKINAGEVDDQILDFEVGEYGLDLYEMAEQRKHSSEYNVETVKTRLKKGQDPFINTKFTHDCTDFNSGVLNSSYKLIPTMQEKVGRQMELVEKIRAVDTGDVARLVIDRHFIRDIKGNLRKFSQQVFRCVKCNEKFRRPPLAGKCTKCGGKIIFTISEGGIIKYLEPALNLSINFDVPPYVKQNLELTKKYIESIFGKETEKQEALGKWF